MPIQFRCVKCQGWIEVDDEHAGAKAICPFCQSVNSVPRVSEQPISARPADHNPYTGVPTESTQPGTPGDLPNKPPREFQPAGTERFEPEQGRFDAERAGWPLPPLANQRLTRIGMLGLAGAILSIGLMIAAGTAAIRLLPAPLQQQVLQSQGLSLQQRQHIQEQVMDQLQTIVQEHAWLEYLGWFGLILWITSLIVNIRVILARGGHRRSYAWAGIAINTIVLFTCLCSGIIQRLAGS